MNPPRYLHFNFADLADDLSITPEKKEKYNYKNFTLIQLIEDLGRPITPKKNKRNTITIILQLYNYTVTRGVGQAKTIFNTI